MSIPKASILTIGDELLLGQIVDTNSAFIAARLAESGFDVVSRLSVGDDENAILKALNLLIPDSDFILITGGLGPTKDDITKKTLADYTGQTLIQNEEILQHLTEMMAKRGRTLNEHHYAQALLPSGADYLTNFLGTAPGIWLPFQEKIIIALPGVPYEMKALLTEDVIPRLQNRFKTGVILHRFIRTVGLPESTIAQKIEHIEGDLPSFIRLAYLPSGGQVKLRLTARGEMKEPLEIALSEAVSKLSAVLGDSVYALSDVELERHLVDVWNNTHVPIYLHDEASHGRLFALLNGQHPKNELIKHSENKGHRHELKTCIQLNISIFYNQENEKRYHITCTMPESLGHKTVELELRPFPVPEVDQNMICLQAMNVIRKLL